VDQLLFNHTTYLAASQVFRHLGSVNWLLAGFNILPGLPLDGGRVLRAAVWRAQGNYTVATRTAVRAGITISLALLFSGILAIRTDIVVGLFCLVIGILLFTMLISSGRPTVGGRRPAPGSVESVMTRDVVMISPDINVDEFINQILKNNRFTTFPVASGGRLHGLLLLEQLKSHPREDWSRLRASDVMRPVDDSMFINSTAPISQAQSLLARNGIGRAAVLDPSGMIVGYISKSDFPNAPTGR
ncbi:MAG TPA: CBS domain-containing protein, partial [Blastocatellia bacterium]|nr:CBS domain-containing protein [Blastocatellia bacterium]